MSASALSVAIRGKQVPVTLAPGIDVEPKRILETASLVDWVRRMENEKTLEVKSVHIQSVDVFGHNIIGFIKFKAEVINTTNGKPAPGIVFARGGSVAILVILKCAEDGKKYTLMTVQPRVPIGVANFLEIPAGMLDGSGNFAGVAAKEMQEETGITVHAEKMIDLTKLASKGAWSGIFPSPGGCDEFIRVFLYRETLPRAKITELEGRLTGCLDENESITLKIIPLDDLWRSTPDAKSLFALTLYEHLTQTGALDSHPATTPKKDPLA
eukprot:tig00020904_g15219.t1